MVRDSLRAPLRRRGGCCAQLLVVRGRVVGDAEELYLAEKGAVGGGFGDGRWDGA